MNNSMFKELRARLDTLSKGHKRIAEYILEHYDKAAFMTAAELGNIVGVSESTVVRFATEMGYEGYPEMQKALREFTTNRLTSIQRIDVMSDQIGSDDLYETVLNMYIDKIRRTLDC